MNEALDLGVDLGVVWRSQAVDADALAPMALREKADTLRWQARRRVLGGYAWGGFFAVQFGLDLARARNAMEVIGNLLCIAGAVFLAVWWRRFAVRPDMQNGLQMRAFLAAFRHELHRQQRLSRSLGVFGLMPLAIGLVVSGSGHLAARHALGSRSFALMAVFGGLVVGLGWIFGRLQAEQLQFRIDEVEAALSDTD